MNIRGKGIVALCARQLACAVGLLMSVCLAAVAAEVNMDDVRKLAREPVETIFAGAPVGRLTAADYWKTVRGSSKPVVVVFYANHDARSRNLATLIRQLALEFGNQIAFYGYPLTGATAGERSELPRLK